ncbi:hypothetical protein V5O48_015732 [Marasmius crinis-equi]|uniref:Putative gamma-glutamylcyclotransferase n=1 Tax=Marasmius crinis-equi TaxID=585013 RepID=A0ABR3ETQ3_9AGAR
MTRYSDNDMTSKLLFFYGTLRLPHVLKEVLNLEETPTLLDASIRGFTLRMWGPYPALVRAEDTATATTIKGKTWSVHEERHLQRLVQYETENYRLAKVDIIMEDTSTTPGYTFVWNSYPEELEDGCFDESQFKAT